MAMAGPNPQQLSQQAIKALTLKGFSYSNPSGEPLVFMVNFPDAKSDVTSSSPDLLAMRLLVRINPNNRTCNLRVGNGQPCNAAHLVKCIDFINECNSREEFGEWVMDVEARQFLFKSCFAWNVGLALDLTPSMSNHIDRSLATYRKYIDAITQVGQTGVAPPLPEYVEPSLDAALSSSSSSSASGAAGSGASGAESAPSPADLLALLLAAQQQRQYS